MCIAPAEVLSAYPPKPVVLSLVGDHKRADFVVLRQLVDIIGRHLFADALGYVRRWCQELGGEGAGRPLFGGMRVGYQSATIAVVCRSAAT